jgi:hypothetical protein
MSGVTVLLVAASQNLVEGLIEANSTWQGHRTPLPDREIA